MRNIQLDATRTTGWTIPPAGRYGESSVDTRLHLQPGNTSMKRSKYDPMATSRLTRWLVLRDMFHNVLDSTELPPGTDLRTAFAVGLAKLEREGWNSEGASGAMVFVRRNGRRRLFPLPEHDPQE